MNSFTRRDVLRCGIALSASSFLSSAAMARVNQLLAARPSVPSLPDLAAITPREQLLFDFGWKFFQGHAADPARDLGFGQDQEDFAKSGAFEFATGKFDDSKWRALNLPHDWAVELPFVHDEALQSHGYKPLGRTYPETCVGWYRREFEIPREDLGRRIVVEFDGAFSSALVFVNGYFTGRNDNGYAPFRFDLSDFLNYGGKNYIVVRIDASFGDGWFYEGAGIYRHVWLLKTEALHLARWESYIRTGLGADAATLDLKTIVQNQGKPVENCRVHWQILDATGRTVASAESIPQGLAEDSSTAFAASARLLHPALWSPENPNLYSAIASVESAGKRYDAELVTFGVRSLNFDPDKGFFLNGNPLKIRGTCNHQDHAGLGAALPDRLHSYRLAVLKEMGSNAVRTSHNMPTPEWVEACDRMGMMMLCETRQMSSNHDGLAQLEVMIKRYRNSPAIIMWSMGNEEEVLESGDPGQRVMAAMVARSHELDPTRLCTAAVNGYFGKGISKSLDVEGFNYNLKADVSGVETKVPQPDAYHRAHPGQPMIGTETASAVSTRGIYITDPLRNWVSAYDLNHPPWAELAEEWWKFYAAREWLAGGFAWTGFDYRGEPTPYGWPSINSQFGIVDMCGFPKDSFFYYKAWWGSEPVLHLFPHWNWEQREGEPVSVWVHSNLDEVELFLNDKSQGKKKVQPLTHLEWTVKYEPGVLEARASKNGKIALTEKRETTGTPVAIRLMADRTEIDANGEDVAVLRVDVLDHNGRPVPTADNQIIFNISGQGTLIGVGNGDPNCQESDKAAKRSLFSGLAQAIVQSTKSPGTITVEAYAEEWPPPRLIPAKIVITTKRVELRAQVA
ncbi:MAG: beta-galactosidase GalA [Candidatus Sulfotelmatobacter sp.]